MSARATGSTGCADGTAQCKYAFIEEREWLARTTLLNASTETVNRLVQSGEGIDMFGHLEMEP